MIAIIRMTCALVILATLASGCATIVKGSTQALTVQTDPEGASCELAREGQTIGAVNPTPGTVQIEKARNDIDVTCKKKGFVNAQASISSTFQGWTAGNILIGGLIGLAVDAGSGAINQYPNEISVKLTPDKFATVEDREAFYEQWRAEVLQNSVKAKILASKQCSKEQCDEVLKKIDRETEQALAGIEANRNLSTKTAAVTAASTRTDAATTGQPSRIIAASTSASASLASAPGYPRPGDRWKYKLIDVKRSAGTVIVEVLDVQGNTVTERITKDGERGFLVEREVDGDFNPRRFQEMVTLPGGFQLAEISPYAPIGQDMKTGQKWSDIPGRFLLTHYGKQQILAQARVITQEAVRVPAGEFSAVRVEAISRNNLGSGTVKITCNYWYASEFRRTVKMSLEIEYQINVPKSIETYELIAFEPAT